MRYRLSLAAPALAGLVLAACSGTEPDQIKAQRTVRAPTHVVESVMAPSYFEAPGTVYARVSTVLSSKIVGRILSLSVREGDRVRQGDVIVEIEDRNAAADLRRAEAAEDEARQALEEVERGIRAAEAAIAAAGARRDLAVATAQRYGMLRDRQSVSAQEFDEAYTRRRTAESEFEGAGQARAAMEAKRFQVLARIEQARAMVAAAEAAMDEFRITSPINGIVTARQGEVGMLAAPGIPLLTVEDDSRYELKAAVDESHISRIAKGQTVGVRIDATNSEYSGTVTEVIPASDPAARTYTVNVSLQLPPGNAAVRSGYFARASFTTGERKALFVPESALVRRGQLVGIYVVQEDAALLRLIKIGKQSKDGIEVISGLDPGERIVTSVNSDIVDGVRVIESAPRSSR